MLKMIKKIPVLRKILKYGYRRFPRVGYFFFQMLTNRDQLIDLATDKEIEEFHIHLRLGSKGKKRVLFLSTYPFEIPRHGGPIRCRALVDQYEKKGYSCIPFIIREEDQYRSESRSCHEVIYPEASKYRMYKRYWVPAVTDYTSGIFALENSRVYHAIKRRINAPIDVIHIEQPWLFKFAEKLTNDFPEMSQSKLVYGSQNIEHKLKDEILNAFKVEKNIINEVNLDIQELELYAAKRADIVLAVSATDQKFLEEETHRKVILAPNAACQRSININVIQSWKQKLPEKFFIFIAGAHIPNFIGFSSILAGFNDILPTETKIVVVGSIVSSLNKFDSDKLIKIGIVSNEDLSAILSLAHAVLIPITLGGGTNLKTAEALLSGKYVISTRIGFRGYDQYANAEGVYLSENAKDFQLNMKQVWYQPAADFSHFRGNDLTWDHAFKTFFEELNNG